MWEYSETLKDHFYHPRNVGEVEDPDGVGEVGSLACGDALRLTFKLNEEKRIQAAKFQTFGCGSAIASSSALTEMIKGLTLEEAEKITNQDIADYLGGMPKEKMHCSVMGREALEAAIASYRDVDLETLKREEGELICECFGVTDKQIIQAIKENDLSTIEQVTNYTKAGGGCGSCYSKIEEIIAQSQKEKEKDIDESPHERKLSNIQKIKLIEDTIEKEIKPSLKADGGDIDLIDVEGNKVMVALRGHCASCPSAEYTLKEYVEKKLTEFVHDELVVEEVK